jgi:hypothetical protein
VAHSRAATTPAQREMMRRFMGKPPDQNAVRDFNAAVSVPSSR